MRPRPGDRPALIDLMALIVAAALSMGVARFVLRVRRSLDFNSTRDDVAICVSLALLAAACSLTFATLRLPGPSKRTLVRRPGAVACLAVCLASLFDAAAYLPHLRSPDTPRGDVLRHNILISISSPYVIVPGLACAWLALALGRRWRPPLGWIDRAGRVVGYAWFLMLAVLWTLNYLANRQ